MKIDFRKIDEARKLLGLDEKASLQEIKDAYRKMALKYHPDRCKGGKKKKCEEMFKKINAAHEVLMTFCAGYKYSFSKAETIQDAVDEMSREHFERFYRGWLGKPR